MHAAALSRINDLLARDITTGRLPGAVAMVVHQGRTALLTAQGQQDPVAGIPMQLDSVFRIYSMTKPVVSLAALMLVEQGRLVLSEPVATYLPEFAGQQVMVMQGGQSDLQPVRRPSTVQDLLRHTSGLTYEFLGDGPVHRQYQAAQVDARGRSNRDGSKLLASLPLQHQPGEVWQYSRSTDVLAAVIEAVTGKGLGAWLTEHIFMPLGMKETGFSVPPALHHRIAQPFTHDPDTGSLHRLFDPREVPVYESGGGGLTSTAADYALFLQMMLANGACEGGRLVSRKTMAWMTSDHLGDIPAHGDLLPAGHGFGLGVAVRTQPGLASTPGSVGMYFWSGIAGTSFFVDPAEGLFAMLLTQAPGPRAYYRSLFRTLVYAALD